MSASLKQALLVKSLLVALFLGVPPDLAIRRAMTELRWARRSSY